MCMIFLNFLFRLLNYFAPIPNCLRQSDFVYRVMHRHSVSLNPSWLELFVIQSVSEESTVALQRAGEIHSLIQKGKYSYLRSTCI